MILIFEGADLVGKSTLADRFGARYGWPVVKIRWAHLGDVRAETHGMATATIQILLATRPDVIFDRIYFSMWAYGEDVSYMPELIAAFDRVSRVAEAGFVLLTASPETLRRRYERQPDCTSLWIGSRRQTPASRRCCRCYRTRYPASTSTQPTRRLKTPLPRSKPS